MWQGGACVYTEPGLPVKGEREKMKKKEDEGKKTLRTFISRVPDGRRVAGAIKNFARAVTVWRATEPSEILYGALIKNINNGAPAHRRGSERERSERKGIKWGGGVASGFATPPFYGWM